MKLWIKILIGISIIGLVIFLYWKFLYFPHAKILRADSTGITWGNNSEAQGKQFGPGSPDQEGTYGRGYMYSLTNLPNRQFRLRVFKIGQDYSPVVDNIFSYDNLPTYLTK